MSATSDVTIQFSSLMMEDVRKAAATEGMTPDQFINVAVAEKLAAIRTAAYFQERSERADMAWFQRFLATGGGDEEPRKGDELPAHIAQ